MKRHFVITCKACGSVLELAVETGEVGMPVIEHEDNCPFYDAIEAGTQDAWIAKNGHPTTYAEKDAPS